MSYASSNANFQKFSISISKTFRLKQSIFLLFVRNHLNIAQACLKHSICHFLTVSDALLDPICHFHKSCQFLLSQVTVFFKSKFCENSRFDLFQIISDFSKCIQVTKNDNRSAKTENRLFELFGSSETSAFT